MTIELLSASKFTIEELVALYNQTRVDYLVPMPMSAQRLQEYVDNFDVCMDCSCVARSTDDGQVLGLGMLGERQSLAWITRLGVLPVSRRGGTGEAIMDFMLDCAEKLGTEETHLEVIKNNHPAHRLFLKKGFVDCDEYLVMRRAPHGVSEPLQGEVEWLDSETSLKILETYPRHLTWINARESMRNSNQVEGVKILFPNGDYGWLVYRLHKFFLSHLVMHTPQGDPVEVGTRLLRHLYTRYPRVDTYAENIYEHDPHLPAFKALSFFENFSRIEMRRKNNVGR